MLKLYTYFRSSAAFRVRIALNLKGLPYESIPVHLLRGAGEQHSESYATRNAARLVPTLADGALSLGQSLAIMEYLEETHPAPALLPADALTRAKVRELALSVACDIHPLNNLRVLRYLHAPLQIEEERRNEWARHWISLGFTAIEHTLERSGALSTGYCFGTQPTLADCCLIPQVFNARRVSLPMDEYPSIQQVHDHCMQLPAFIKASPGAQSDAE
ncbi:MAG TPA: maleylacetoacetate isomerase [Steroidobacteraceae bacterium]|jgi:maleylacetoacetate isomerase|nr:maleylacetoacetate isomerase [Steroidobacteraceae bacterium]